MISTDLFCLVVARGSAPPGAFTPNATISETSLWGMASTLPPGFCSAPFAANRTQILPRRPLFRSRDAGRKARGRAKTRPTRDPRKSNGIGHLSRRRERGRRFCFRETARLFTEHLAIARREADRNSFVYLANRKLPCRTLREKHRHFTAFLGPDMPARFAIDQPVRQAPGVLRHIHAPRNSAGLHTGREVDRVAPDIEGKLPYPHDARNHGPAVQTDSNVPSGAIVAGTQLFDYLNHIQCRQHGIYRMRSAFYGKAAGEHIRIADRLQLLEAVAVDNLIEHSEIFIQRADEVSRRHPFARQSKPDEIRKTHRHIVESHRLHCSGRLQFIGDLGRQNIQQKRLTPLFLHLYLIALPANFHGSLFDDTLELVHTRLELPGTQPDDAPHAQGAENGI